MKFSSKLILSIIAVSLVVVPLFSVRVFTSTRIILQNQITIQNKDSVKSTMETIDRILHGAYRDIQAIAEDQHVERWIEKAITSEAEVEPDVSSYREQATDIYRFLEEQSQLTGPWDIIFIVDDRGAIVASTDSKEIGKAITAEPQSMSAYEHARRGDIYYSDLVVSDDTGWPTIIFAAPIRSEEEVGRPLLGVVIANFSWPVIEEVLADRTLPPAHSHLVTKEGMLIAEVGGRQEVSLSKNFASHPLVKKRFSSGSGIDLHTTVVKDDTEFLSVAAEERGFLGYKGNDWLLLKGIPLAEIFAPITEMAIQVTMATLFILAAVVVLSSIVGRILTRPIEQLNKAVQRVGTGDLTARVEVKTKDEIGALAHSFNQMLINLEQRTVSKDYLDDIITSINDALIVVTLSGQIKRVNKTTCELLRYAEGELINKNIKMVLLEDSISFLDLSLRENGVKDYEAKLRASNSQEIEVSLSGSAIRDNQGEVSDLVCIAKDITEQKQMEEELRQAHKMEAVGTLAGGIAHDFNNLIAAILGYAEIAKRKIPDDGQAINQIEQVLKAGNRAKELVKQILSFSRKETQGLIPVEIHSIVEEALKLLRASLPTTIEIRQRIDPRCGNIRADPGQVHQVVINLCTNSAHAMEDKGGLLEVELQAIDFDNAESANKLGLKPGTYTLLSVKDNGIGIEESLHDKIFDPYFTTKGVGKGSGMGLAVVTGIVNNHNGVISVASQPGKGSTFSVYFPRCEDAVQGENDTVRPLPTGNERILIIDDEEQVADMTRQRVEHWGYQATTRFNSTEALTHFRSQPDNYDLVISDQTMPGLTGGQLAKELLNIKADLPIILCTGYSEKIDAEKANILGISAFIMKPVDNRELAEAIRTALDKNTKG